MNALCLLFLIVLGSFRIQILVESETRYCAQTKAFLFRTNSKKGSFGVIIKTIYHLQSRHKTLTAIYFPTEKNETIHGEAKTFLSQIQKIRKYAILILLYK